MSSLTRFLQVRWVRNFELTDADQPVGPILGILSHLRSDQWLVLFRTSNEERIDYYPFKKREIVDRLSLQQPTIIASEALDLAPSGVEVVARRVSRFPAFEEENIRLPRLALLDEQGKFLGIGVTREERVGSTSGSDRFSESVNAEIRHSLVREMSEVEILHEGEAQLPAPAEEKKSRKREDEPPSVIVPVYYGTDRKRYERRCKTRPQCAA